MRTLILAILLAACGGESAPPPAPVPTEPAVKPVPPPQPPPAPPAADVWKLPEGSNPAMLNPAAATATAPATYKVKFETTEGEFVVQVNRDWAPAGADRFYNLVQIGYFSDIAFFRAIEGFMVQFGISGYPDVSAAWREARIDDDPVKQTNSRGRLTFATAGPNTRTTQLFINYRDNANLDGMGFSPIGEVVSGMDIVDKLHKGYGEGAPRGRGPNQGLLQSRGNAYLKTDFPELDYILKASVVE